MIENNKKLASLVNTIDSKQDFKEQFEKVSIKDPFAFFELNGEKINLLDKVMARYTSKSSIFGNFDATSLALIKFIINKRINKNSELSVQNPLWSNSVRDNLFFWVRKTKTKYGSSNEKNNRSLVNTSKKLAQKLELNKYYKSILRRFVKEGDCNLADICFLYEMHNDAFPEDAKDQSIIKNYTKAIDNLIINLHKQYPDESTSSFLNLNLRLDYKNVKGIFDIKSCSLFDNVFAFGTKNDYEIIKRVEFLQTHYKKMKEVFRAKDILKTCNSKANKNNFDKLNDVKNTLIYFADDELYFNKIIEDKNFNVNIKDSKGVSLLSAFASAFFVEKSEKDNFLFVVNIIFDKDRIDNIEEKNLQEETLLMLSIKNNNIMVFDKLIELGADIYTKNNEGINTLGYACLNGNQYMIRKLVEMGVDEKEIDNDGMTAVQYAQENDKSKKALTQAVSYRDLQKLNKNSEFKDNRKPKIL